jgi:hypothetical protein
MSGVVGGLVGQLWYDSGTLHAEARGINKRKNTDDITA